MIKISLLASILVLSYADISGFSKPMCKVLLENNLVPSDVLWDSKPSEISQINLQILDKISGNVLRTTVNVGDEICYGTIRVIVKRAFKNSPDDRPEVYAYIKIQENESTQFENWLFASAPSANLFAHAEYDVRVEF